METIGDKNSSMRPEQVSSSQHQVNPAASLNYLAERQKGPSSSYRAKAADSIPVLEKDAGPFRRTGSGMLTRQGTELGRPSLASQRQAGQQGSSISLRVKRGTARRESDQGIVPLRSQGQHNPGTGKALCLESTLAAGVSGGHGAGNPYAPNSSKGQEVFNKTQQLQSRLWASAKSNKNRRFHALYDRIYRYDILEIAWSKVKANRGTSGVDGQTIQEIESKGVEPFLREIETELREGRYSPPPVRRVYIPKPDGRQRPLGIPTIRDRVVQTAARLVLEPIFEADFKDFSYGFRPKRSALYALERIRLLANKGMNFVLDADIKDYFGTIRHDQLIKLLKLRISDRRALKLIRQWLQAGVLEEGKFKKTLLGTPQGGGISPLLSNVYLNQLDKQWEENNSTWGRLTRYADDFIVQCVSAKQAAIVKIKIASILKSLGLTPHPEKTRLVELRWGKEGFDFLGHHLRKMPSYRFAGKFFLNRWPSQRAMKSIYAKLKGIVNRRRFGVSNIRQLVPEINRVLAGWTNYFRSGNANRQFAKVERYLWFKLMRFECKRRLHQAPYRSAKYDRPWYLSLGITPLVGSIRYPNPSLVLVKANA